MIETPDNTDSNDLDTAVPTNGPSPAGEPASASQERAAHPDPFELLLGVEGQSIPSREPIVVCIDGDASSEYLGMLETIAVRLYRERVGGTPTPLRLTDLDELVDETRWLQAESHVVTISLSDADWETLETEFEGDWTRIWSNRIQNQLFAQTFGVLIVNRRVIAPPGDHFPKIYQLDPPVPPTDVQWRVGAIASGFFDQREGGLDERHSFSQRFNYWQEERQRRAWYRLKTRHNGMLWDTATPDASASELHRRLKAFAVQALSSHLEIDTATASGVHELTEHIQVEQPLSTTAGDEIRPDVLCEFRATDRTVAIEAETLFAAGRGGSLPRDTLRRTIRKYESCSTVDDLVILVDPLTIVTQGGTIASVAESIESNPNLPSVTFASVDFTTGHLRSVASIRRAWRAHLGDDEQESIDREVERPCCKIA